MKTCTRCGTTKPLSGFSKKGRWLSSRCKDCRAAEQRARYDPEKARAYHDANREHRNASRREWHKRMRQEAIDAYGGQCACCGETERAFLVIDHVNGGGNEQRRLIGGRPGGQGVSHHFWRWLRDHGYPPGYQVLCANCNMAKEFNPGGCPHQQVAEQPVRA